MPFGLPSYIMVCLFVCECLYIQKEGSYKGKKFNAICHFFGYQARGSLPSKFDCDYAYVSSLISILNLGYCYLTMKQW